MELVWTHTSVIRMALGRSAFDAFVAMFEAAQSADENKPWNERLVFRIFD
ncbi:hypothetical protein [Actinoplanes sp. M2I2]|nr:hypothetical protein [Actinoplanes sp. M2I2]